MDEDIVGMSFKHFFVFVTTESNMLRLRATSILVRFNIYLFIFSLAVHLIASSNYVMDNCYMSVGRVYCMLINIIKLKGARIYISRNQRVCNTF